MKYRMKWLGYDEYGRERWRGTGFSLAPDGITWIENLEQYQKESMYHAIIYGTLDLEHTRH